MSHIEQIDEKSLKKALKEVLFNKKNAKMFLKLILQETKNVNKAITIEKKLILQHIIFAAEHDAYYKELTAKEVMLRLVEIYNGNISLNAIRLGKELSLHCKIAKRYRQGIAIYPIKDINK